MTRMWSLGVVFGFVCVMLISSVSMGHFGMIIPSSDIIGMEENRTIDLAISFAHPMEGDYMEMEYPIRFGVYNRGETQNLLSTITAARGQGALQQESFTFWETQFTVKRPGDYTFFVEPVPYWEPAEDSFIIHFTKVCVHALGLEVGWDEAIGLETEIVPLTRPYGLWTGNIFTGIVTLQGEPVPFSEIEVEYYDRTGSVTVPADPYVTQVVRADERGVFSYAMPRAGWWGFAALNEAPWTLRSPDGEDKPVELGAVYWVQTRDMK